MDTCPPSTTVDTDEHAIRQEEELEALESILDPSSVWSATDVRTGSRLVTVNIDVDLGELRLINLRRRQPVEPPQAWAAGYSSARKGDGRDWKAMGGPAEVQVAHKHGIQSLRKGRMDVEEETASSPHSGSSPGLWIRYPLPFQLRVKLPPRYPDAAPDIDIDCTWLPESRKRDALTVLQSFHQNVEAECLALCVDYLRYDLFQSDGAIEVEDRDGLLAERMRRHDRATATDSFKKESFRCEVCLEDRKGARCYRLETCRHVFCVECLVDYWSMLITEGSVRLVHCCSTECVSARARAPSSTPTDELPGSVAQHELDFLLGPTLTARYIKLREKQRAESNPAVCFCPRQGCGAAVEPEPGVSPDDTNMRQCGQCGMPFCCVCGTTWHGVNPCPLPKATSIVERYLAADEAEQQSLERRYGRKNIQLLVRTFEEERANAAWKDANTTICKHCGVHIEKSAGCNHMTCSKCGAHFCFRCGERLGTDPYKHFSTPGLGCFNKLFDYVPTELTDEDYVRFAELAGGGD